MLTDAMRQAYSKSGYFRLVTVGGGARADVVYRGGSPPSKKSTSTSDEWLGRVWMELQLRDARPERWSGHRSIRRKSPWRARP